MLLKLKLYDKVNIEGSHFHSYSSSLQGPTR